MLNINLSTEEQEEEEDVFEVEDSDVYDEEAETVRNPPMFSTDAYVPYTGPVF